MLNNNDNQGVVNFYSWETDFDAIVVIDGVAYPNLYNVQLSFLPHTTEIKLQNNSFERVKYLFSHLAQNSIITNQNDTLQTVWFKMPVNKILLPSNPYDHLLCRVLYRKIQAIAGKYLHIGQLRLDSRLGDNVQYTIDNDSFDDGIFQKANWLNDKLKEPWWDRNDTATFDQMVSADEYWTGVRSWRELGYGSDAPKKEFNPTIISGGKDK